MPSLIILYIKKIIKACLKCCLSGLLLLGSLSLFFYRQAQFIVINSSHLSFNTLPQSFEGYRIVQLSDLHSKTFFYEEKRLIQKIQALEPDLIVITGDFIDGHSKKAQPCLQLLQGLQETAPIYYVYGNHEGAILYDKHHLSFFKKIQALGVHILYNDSTILTSPTGETIGLLGITDPQAIDKTYDNKAFIHTDDLNKRVEQMLKLTFDKEASVLPFQIVLSHRPEFFPVYCHFPNTLFLTGHTHGGQIRLPFLGGLYSSDEGYFPKYDGGIYKDASTTMLVSKGLGTGGFPIRLFNPPEINLIILHCYQ